ncbi:ErfK/YbiS/YcfS/YnhG [Gardnerella vaginalis JCP8481A]|uniref:ErfK/YbiS/YcfS/YnhG n=2 Tax=Bifidobacteriaceae TaxID=31953 RepID=A0A133NS73_GARVA|nr:ErfK/YbiS/YcfS/YnhG [Gardnerella vaginalis JCP8481A]EPI42564.1 ErfK/YbiS/YcfS/YnhG [Gardnerella vaginalis JCP8481B]KXA19108.1 ErfK/YbiS/YcfS/YnhG [Gardnerella vaginalis]
MLLVLVTGRLEQATLLFSRVGDVMQFIHKLMNDIRKCTHSAVKVRDWWQSASVAMRIVIGTCSTIVFIAWVCFIGFETFNMVSAAQRYQLLAPNAMLIQRKQNNSGNHQLYINNNDADSHKFAQRHTKRCGKRASCNTRRVKSDFWRKPTGGKYPNLDGIPVSQLRVRVNLTKQRVHVIANGKNVYTMVISSGMDNSTPHGDYMIGMRGTHFFNTTEGVGADYWVGFIGGQYLFHSVPTRYNFGEYIPSEGVKLGSPASHGCVRLSVADAKWFYDHIPTGTAVHID